MPQHYAKAPTKFIDIKDTVGKGLRAITPDSLAFLLASQIPPAESTGIDPRRLQFSDISPQLRDQRQQSLANPAQNNAFSVFGAYDALNRNVRTPR